MSYDYHDYMQEEAESRFWENLPTQLHDESVSSYLGVYGDSIAARVVRLSDMAQQLHSGKFFGPSVVVSATAIEVMIAYFCVRPMVEGAFVSEAWAECLAAWVVATRPADQRKILVAMLKLWKIDVAAILLEDGKTPLWSTIQTVVFEARNKFAHRGDDVTEGDSQQGIVCTNIFQKKIILPMSLRLGFTLSETGLWAKVAPTDGSLLLNGVRISGRGYTARDIFAKQT